MSAAHDSVFKTIARPSRCTPRRSPLRGSRRFTPSGSLRRVGTARTEALSSSIEGYRRTSDAPSLRGLAGRALARPPMSARGSLARSSGHTREPRPPSPRSVKMRGIGSTRGVFHSRPRASDRRPGSDFPATMRWETRREHCSVNRPSGHARCLDPPVQRPKAPSRERCASPKGARATSRTSRASALAPVEQPRRGEGTNDRRRRLATPRPSTAGLRPRTDLLRHPRRLRLDDQGWVHPGSVTVDRDLPRARERDSGRVPSTTAMVQSRSPFPCFTPANRSERRLFHHRLLDRA
jgi:hypothetical protein